MVHTHVVYSSLWNVVLTPSSRACIGPPRRTWSAVPRRSYLPGARRFYLDRQAGSDIERGERRFARTCERNGDLGGATRRFSAVDRDQDAQLAMQRIFDVLFASIDHDDRSVEAGGKACHIVVKLVAGEWQSFPCR